MRKSLVLAALMASCALSMPLPAAADGAPQLAPEADTLPRPTDDALRTSMEGLRALLAARLTDGGAGKMTEAEHVTLADEIDRQVAALAAGRDFHNPAGRHLQWVLGDITDGATLMRTAARVQGKRFGLLRVVETLNFYGREYEHPGWVALQP